MFQAPPSLQTLVLASISSVCVCSLQKQVLDHKMAFSFQVWSIKASPKLKNKPSILRNALKTLKTHFWPPPCNPKMAETSPIYSPEVPVFLASCRVNLAAARSDLASAKSNLASARLNLVSAAFFEI